MAPTLPSRMGWPKAYKGKCFWRANALKEMMECSLLSRSNTPVTLRRRRWHSPKPPKSGGSGDTLFRRRVLACKIFESELGSAKNIFLYTHKKNTRHVRPVSSKTSVSPTHARSNSGADHVRRHKRAPKRRRRPSCRKNKHSTFHKPGQRQTPYNHTSANFAQCGRIDEELAGRRQRRR